MSRTRSKAVRRSLRLRYNSPVVLSFALLGLAALLADSVSLGRSRELLFSVYSFSPDDPLGYIRLLTHVLGHSSWEHYSGNIMLILVIGPALEHRYGSRNLLLCIMLTALVTGVAQCLLFPNSMLCGASGVVFMMILLASMGGTRSGGIPLTMVAVAVFYLGGELAAALSVRDNISQLSHILGGVCGAAMGFYLESRE